MNSAILKVLTIDIGADSHDPIKELHKFTNKKTLNLRRTCKG